MTFPPRRVSAVLLTALTSLAAAVLPLTVPASALTRANPRPDLCAPPAAPSATGPVRIALDWSTDPMPPGSRPTMTVHVTNTGDRPTADPTLVVVHLPSPNEVSGPPGIGFTFFGTGGSYTVPAGLAPGAEATTVLTLSVHGEDAPNSVMHCDVTSFTGNDHDTVLYDVVTGDPVVKLSVLMPQTVEASPGQTVSFLVSEHNAGPSIAYDDNPTVMTLTAPGHTRWTGDAPYRCTVDGAGRMMTCSEPGSPLTWRDNFRYPTLTVDSSVRPGTVLAGGMSTISNHWDCGGDHPTPFTVTVVAPATP
ncbi:hypothetical protein [Streptacidiphilus carbonis]|uniref:hypothetical protein n=1 Tax=Streptacidiphilus carbonis TaxID=105422 RepID=UPI0005A8F42E|nr:hypothetical protein [Streptacidiphilus carbonis]